MILVAYVLCAVSALVLIAFSHTHRQMNTAAIGQGLLFVAITAYVLFCVQVPVDTFMVGSGYFFIDHLGTLRSDGRDRYSYTCRRVCPGVYREPAGKRGAGNRKPEALLCRMVPARTGDRPRLFFGQSRALLDLCRDDDDHLRNAGCHSLGKREHRRGDQVHLRRFCGDALFLCRAHLPLRDLPLGTWHRYPELDGLDAARCRVFPPG